jgi:formate hydrogenlyase subunit 6/NADH:ubiquinone oxidoreductase subunit I
MAKYEISVAPEECVGCLRCELACSDAYSKAFNLTAARIRVSISDVRCAIDFTEECVVCGICADYCLYGALSKIKKEGVTP